jgi:hypothetical protein
MASPAQILANRDNAQLSSGPKTPAGKQTSGRNATRHGLTGTQIVMPGEDPAAFEELQRGLHQAHRPANDAERLLVDQIAANAWRLMRAQRIETACLAKLVENQDNPDAALAAAFLERPADLARIQRYVTAAQNAYYKAMSQLSKLQKERAIAEYEAAALEAMRSSRPEPAIGFVSQPEPAHEPEPSGSVQSPAAPHNLSPSPMTRAA